MGDIPALLQESEELHAWLLANGFHRQAMRLQTHTVRLLRIQGDMRQALALGIRNMTLGIRYVDRARLLFATREMGVLLPHWETSPANRRNATGALSFLDKRLSEIVHGRNGTSGPAPRAITRQLAPLSELLPRVVEPDWVRLVSEVPEVRVPTNLFL